MSYNVAQPKVSIVEVGDRFQAVIRFPSGPFNGRRPIIGLVMPTVHAAIADALGKVVPVIVDIVTPHEYPNAD